MSQSGSVSGYPGGQGGGYPGGQAGYQGQTGYPVGNVSQAPQGNYRVSGASNMSGVSGVGAYGGYTGQRAPSVSALSRQSAASGTSHRTIASEYQHKQTHQKLQGTQFGPGRTPFRYGIIAAVIGGLFLLGGLVFLILLKMGRMSGTSDKEEFVGPLLLAVGVVALFVAGWFFYTAKKKSNSYRQRLRFKPNPVNSEKVSVVNIAYEPDRSSAHASGLKSGSATDRAVSQVSYNSSLASNTLGDRGRHLSNNPAGSHGGYSRPDSLTSFAQGPGPQPNMNPSGPGSRPASVHSNFSNTSSIGVHPVHAAAFANTFSAPQYTEPKDTAL